MTQTLYHIEGDTESPFLSRSPRHQLTMEGPEPADPRQTPKVKNDMTSPDTLSSFLIINAQGPAEAIIDSDAQLVHTASQRCGHAAGHEEEESAQIKGLMQQLFGPERATVDEQRTRHVGVVWKNLTVKGLGLGAALQPTLGDILASLVGLVKALLTRGGRPAGAEKPEIRTILKDFTVSVHPGMIERAGT